MSFNDQRSFTFKCNDLTLNPPTHLTNANTVSEDSAGDGAMTTSASPSSTNSHSIWMWKKTGWKHLDGQRMWRFRQKKVFLCHCSTKTVQQVVIKARRVKTLVTCGSHLKRSTSWMVGSTMDTWLSLWKRQRLFQLRHHFLECVQHLKY